MGQVKGITLVTLFFGVQVNFMTERQQDIRLFFSETMQVQLNTFSMQCFGQKNKLFQYAGIRWQWNIVRNDMQMFNHHTI
jgi:hypothetical protein